MWTFINSFYVELAWRFAFSRLYIVRCDVLHEFSSVGRTVRELSVTQCVNDYTVIFISTN